MKKNFIHREIQEELQRGANGRRNIPCGCLRPANLIENPTVYRGIEPLGETDQGNGKNNVNREDNLRICAGIEGFFLINEKCHDLGRYVGNCKGKEIAKPPSDTG